MSYSFEVANLYKSNLSHPYSASTPQIKIEPDLYSENSPPPSVMSSVTMQLPHNNHHLQQQQQPLPHTNNSSSTNELLKCKKRVQNFSKMSPYSSATLAHSPNLPTSVVRRNERERNRVKMVNMGFATLRQHVPNGVKNKKMSKVETLRSAVDYIRELQKLLGQTGDSSFFSDDQFQLSLDVPSTSGDENCYPPSVGSSMAPSPVDSSSNLDQQMIYTHNQVPYSHIPGSIYSTSPSNHSDLSSKLYGVAAISPIGQHHHHNPSSQTSPSPSSVGSDITSSSSPYNSMTTLDHSSVARPTTTLLATAIQTAVPSTVDELFDFANWF